MKLIKRLIAVRLDGTLLCLLLSVYFVFFLNWQLNAEVAEIIAEASAVKTGFVISLPIFLICFFNILFNLLCWPGVARPVFSLLILVSAVLSYAAYNYGAIFDRNMIVNLVETNSSESLSYLSRYSVLWFLYYGVLPVGLLWLLKVRYGSERMCFLLTKLLSIIMSILVLLMILVFYYKDYASLARNHNHLKKMIIPTYFINSTSKYIDQHYISEPLSYRKLGLDAQQSVEALKQAEIKPTLFIYVVGETARAHNYQGAGYERNTTPHTKELGLEYVATLDSCGTSTAVSVPCMFSELTRNDYDHRQALAQDNLLDVLVRAGVDAQWIENNGGDKGVATRINKITIDTKSQNEFCNSKSCLDIALLDDFESNIEQMSGNRVLVLHMIGSHGPTYYQRYPKEMTRFLPDCPRADIENCSLESIVNTYDNTIAYTDYVLAQTIKRLQKLESSYNTALLYVSDHGESLGEGGLFLHGLPYSLAPEYQKKVPLMFWASSGFKQQKGLDTACLGRWNAKQLSHDNLFHSLLGIMDVSSTIYDETLDLFASCR